MHRRPEVVMQPVPESSPRPLKNQAIEQRARDVRLVHVTAVSSVGQIAAWQNLEADFPGPAPD